MTTALTITNDSQYVELVKQQIMQSVNRAPTNTELQLFMATCQRTGLDPLMRQIYCIERRSRKGEQWVIKFDTQVSIDGMRLVAERTDRYEGQVGPLWCGDDGKWCDVWLSDRAPAAAKVGVWKRGFREPLWAVALYSEYAQTKNDGSPTQFWARMPALMLAKCAESLALRKAFPNDLSGLYTREEMMQAENEDASYVQPVQQTRPQIADSSTERAGYIAELRNLVREANSLGFDPGLAGRKPADMAVREMADHIDRLVLEVGKARDKFGSQAPLTEEWDAIEQTSRAAAGVAK